MAQVIASLLAQTAALLWAGNTAGATAMHKRYSDFNQRCMAAGMPKGYYGIERSGAVLVAQPITGGAFALFIEGKQVASDTSKQVVLQRYYTARDASNGGRTNSEYVAHAANCTPAKAAAREAAMTTAGVALTKGTYRVSGRYAQPAQPAPKGKGKGTSK